MLRLLVILTVILLSASPSFADVYKYIDENGVVCYTDSPFGRKAELVYREKKQQVVKTVDTFKYKSFVKNAASKYELEPELINAVIKTESNGNHRAVSRKGAMGLMQLMPSTANDMNVMNPFNPEENIDGGTKYLRYLLEKFNGNLTLALAAYNAGPTVVEKYGSIPPFAETKEYVKRVFSLYKGKKRLTISSEVTAKHTPIYKVVLKDGTILFTNSSFARGNKLRF
jgi:hypothetical protein